MTSAARSGKSEEASWASNVLRNIKLSAEAQGMKFFVDPPREVVPAFLGDFQPDAIAVGSNGGIVIEIKRGQNADANRQQLAEISERISREKGWEFRAIYLTSRSEQVNDIPIPTLHQLRLILGRVELLAKEGHQMGALLVGWSVLEALAHVARARDGAESSYPRSPLQAVQALAEEGYVDNDVASRLRGFAAIRNAVAHGDISVEVTQEQVEELLRDLRAIFSAIEAVEALAGAP